MMNRSILLVAVALGVAQAWVVPPLSTCRNNVPSFTRIASSNDPDDEIVSETSFDEAGAKILQDENDERAASMANDEEDIEFEQKKGEYEAIREAIRARTAELGVEKSFLTNKILEEKEARAAAGQSVEGLDLSQITGSLQAAPTASDDDDGFELPSMFYDPDEQLTEEQKKEVDKVASMPLLDQAKDELNYVEWPDLVSTLKEVALVIVLSVVTGALIINWDGFLRDTYTDVGWIPRPEDIGTQFDGLELPEGWTDMMSDEDLATIPDKVAGSAAAAKSAVTSTLGDL